MKRAILSLAAGAVCLAVSFLQAAVPTGNLQTFNTQPLAVDWSTLNVPGSGGTAGNSTTTIAEMDTAVQTNTVAIITNRLLLATSAAPGGNASAQWSSASQNVITRPTGNSYTILMATIQNTTGSAINSAVPISYDFALPSALAGEDAELAGLRAYFSLTGAPGSWALVPELTSATPTPVAGPVSASVNFGSWPAGGILYLIWIDDNGGPGTDGSYSIDNFIIGSAPPPPTISQQPANTNNIVGRTVSLTVVANGSSLTYQWQKIGFGPLDTTANPSAATATLVITNAQTSDTGDYYVSITSPYGNIDSAQAHIQINLDEAAPQFLLASVVGPGLNTFRLTTDEQLCADAASCGGDFTAFFNWQINPSDDPSGTSDLGAINITMINPTTYEFLTTFDRDPAKQYRITVTPDFGEISDLYGNKIPAGSYAETVPQRSFQQGDANSYAGTHDTEVRQNTPDDNTLGSRDFFNVDQSDNTIGGGTAGPVDGLIRFDNVFGNGPTQVPPGSTIINVKLVLSSSQANANGNPINMHRMLIPWDESTTTWNSTVEGITADGVEASIAPDAPNFDTALTVPFVITLDSATYPGMLSTVQAWANGTPNYGWALLPTGTDGYRVDSSEALSVATHPMLVIEYRAATCSGAPVIVGQPPATVSANELQSFSITAGVSNACDATFQWTRNGTDIAGANQNTYDVASARPVADSGTYRLRVTSPGGTVTSSAAVVTVHPKTTHPHVTRVASSANGTTITVAFSEAVSTASAQNTANYTLTPAVTVSGAVLGANNTVTLTTAARNVSTAYSLRIANVTDTAETPNVIDPNPTILNLTSVSVVAGAEWNSNWLYNSNNLDSTSGAWKDTGYTPGADWGTGPALFGSETGAALTAAPAPIGTPLTPNSVAATSEQLVTTYFRKSITLPALPAGARYVMCHYADDGFIAYLDGAEIYRFGMPAGAVTFTNRSTGIPTGDATYRSFSFTATPGAHMLAVELHQAGVTTSDVLFGMEVHVLGGAAPSLSISHAEGGPVNLSWNADGNWRLRGAAVVNGPYLDVTIPGTSLPGTFSLPSGSVTNRNFWLLDYICPP